MAVNTAPVKWAQRADSIYLTLDLPDVKDEQLKLTKDMLSFSGTSGDKPYALDLEFLHDVNSEKSTWKVLPRSIQMHIMKEDEDEGFWARLLKDKSLEKTNVKIDWNKFVDEDEDEPGAEGFDMSALNGGSGFGGQGGMPPGGMGGMPPGGMGGMPGMEGMGGMPGMGGMGGMPGMGGMGGMGGMPGMGGMGGMGGEGGMPAGMAEMMAKMKAGGGMMGAGGEDDYEDEDDDEADSDDEGLPDLEDDDEAQTDK